MGKKVISQCISLIEAGLDVQLVLVGYKNIDCPDLPFIKRIIVQESSSFPLAKKFPRIMLQYKLSKIFDNIIGSSSSSHIVYVRYPYPMFYLLWPFFGLRKRCKILNEHNTIEHVEFKLGGDRLHLLIELLMGNLMRHRSDGIVSVTNEITFYEIRRSGNFNKPHITIGNGIDVKSVKVRKPPSFTGKELRLLCVASVGPWHGLDRMLKGLALYKGKAKIQLYVAGDGGKELQKLKTLVKDLMLEDNVVFTGFMSGSALDDLFNLSHIAIGTLGMHRKKMKEGSILKAREYCARGIPFLYDCSDADFPYDFPYILKVPADESPIDVEEIIQFAGKVYSDPEHYLRMRAYAEKKLDWSVKMKRLKVFCETLV